MASQETETISITLNNGQCFEHHPPRGTPEERRKFADYIIAGWKKTGKGILTLNFPLAIYNSEHISSIHFLDMVEEKTSIGFQPNV